MWSSLKLVMTSKTDITSVPHSVILPLADEREVFSFQVQDLARFTLELSLYPTFGSKVIGRAIVLPSMFTDIQNHQGLVVPLLDHHLKTIGEVAFEVSCIKPFQGAQLEIGGRVETYWKSKVTPSAPSQDHAHQFQSHRPLSVSTSSPALRPPTAAPPSIPARESALVTASSLSGEYVHIVVQLTKDQVPVLYPGWTLPVPGFDIGVADVSSSQFDSLATSLNRNISGTPNHQSPAEWCALLRKSMASLEAVLALLPAETGVNIQLKYAREFDAKYESVGRSGEVNAFVDSVLHVVYEAGKTSPGRKIIFSSFDPTVCTALNWKQPNCESSQVLCIRKADFQMLYSLLHIVVCPGRGRMHRSSLLEQMKRWI
jgi:CDK inhibitor PHO81